MKKYFGRFTSKKQFFDTNVKPDTLQTFYANIERGSDGLPLWHEVKLILLHKNCPDNIRRRYANSKVWYERIPAMLSKYSWEKYARIALQDRKSTVAAAALRRLLYEGRVTVSEALDFVKKNKYVAGYFKGLKNEQEEAQKPQAQAEG